MQIQQLQKEHHPTCNTQVLELLLSLPVDGARLPVYTVVAVSITSKWLMWSHRSNPTLQVLPLKNG